MRYIESVLFVLVFIQILGQLNFLNIAVRHFNSLVITILAPIAYKGEGLRMC